MPQPRSAALLMYRLRAGAPEVLLAHPGGPFWKNRDQGAWSLPKGELGQDEDPLAGACREFREETGFTAAPPFVPLGEVRQKSGKRVLAWAFEGDADETRLRCNSFEIEWPPRSGRMQAFPEVDRAQWFALPEARRRILPAQLPFIDRLLAVLDAAAAVPRTGPGL
jgi:predicted NUDIX family NTP pyrophosphohydrolase